MPTESATKRLTSGSPATGWPEARQKATSPSTSENTGSTARATPALAIRATRVQAGLSSGASVITQTRVVLRSSSRVQSGSSVIAAIAAAVEAEASPSTRSPASTAPSAPITSPNALTTASAATRWPRPVRAGGVADPRRVPRSRPAILPTAAPVPAPTLPALGHAAAAASQAA